MTSTSSALMWRSNCLEIESVQRTKPYNCFKPANNTMTLKGNTKNDQDFMIRRLIRHERFREALDALAGRPASTWTTFLRAIASHGVGEHRVALQLLRQLQESPINRTFHARCAWEESFALTKCGELDAAAARLEAARALYATLGDINASKGKVRCDWLAASITLRRGFFAQAHDMAEGAAQEAADLGMSRIHVYAACTQCVSLRLLGRHRELDDVLAWALPLAKRCRLSYRTAVLEYEAATSLFERGDAKRATHFLLQADRSGNLTGARLLQADILTLHANMAAARHQINRAISFHKRASRLYFKAGLRSGVALCHRNMGHLYLSKSDYPRALKAAQLSERLALHSDDGRMKRLAWLLIGVIYRWTGNPERACQYLGQAAAACEAAQDWVMAASAISEMAFVVSPAEQAALSNRASMLAEGVEDSLHTALVHRILSELHLKTGNAQQALRFAESSLRIFSNAGASLHAGTCELMAVEARLALAENDSSMQRADNLVALHKTIETLCATLKHLPEHAAHISQLNARVLSALGHLEDALKASIHSAMAESWVRATVPDPVLSSHLAANSHTHYHFGARLAIDKDNSDAMLMLAQCRRSEWTQRMRLPLSPQDQQRADDLLADIRRHRKQVFMNAWPMAPSSDRDEYAAAQMRSAYEQLDLLHLATSGPVSGHPIRNFSPATVAQVRSLLCQKYGDHWTLIILESTAKKDAWVVVRLTPEMAEMRQVHASAILSRILQASTTPDRHYPQVIYDATNPTALASLSDWLGVEHWLPKGASRGHRLIIADCEPFTRLGFAALPTTQGLLGRRAIISFCPSLRTDHTPSSDVATPHGHQQDSAFMQALFVAAHTRADGDAFPLRGVSREVNHCASFWPGARIMEGSAATPARVKQFIDAEQPALIHFASHAHHDREMPRLSALLLHGQALSAMDITRWQISTRLVCLSGCEGGRVWQQGGEERLSVESAWMAAGAHQVLSTPWPVHDLASIHTMASFHQHYASIQDATLALHRAICEQPLEAMAHWAGWRIMTRTLA